MLKTSRHDNNLTKYYGIRFLVGVVEGDGDGDETHLDFSLIQRLKFIDSSTAEKCAFLFLPGMISRHALSRNVIHKDCKLGMILTNWKF